MNFDPAELATCGRGGAWNVDERMQMLTPEEPGPPVPDGPWQRARRLMHSYEFADRSRVRASFDGEAPLEGRTMLLEIRYLGLRLHVGCRVADVYERREIHRGREALIWGWSYRTLRGHFEQGEMAWEVLKWPDTGEVAFRIHACSRRAPDPNPVVRLGFRLFGRREQLRFYDATCRRMRALTAGAPAEAA